MKKDLEREKYGWAVKKEEGLAQRQKAAAPSLSSFLRDIAWEYGENKTILGFGRQETPRATRERPESCHGRPCAMPFGPGASPLTARVPGIASAYLAGARFFELPVQWALARALSEARSEGEAGARADAGLRPSMRVLSEFATARMANLVLGRILNLDLDSGPAEPCVYTANLSAERDPESQDFLAALSDGRARRLENAAIEELSLLAAEDPFRGTELAGRLEKVGDLAVRAKEPFFAALSLAIPDGLPLAQAEERVIRAMDDADIPLELKIGPWILGSERLADIFRRCGAERDPRGFGRNASTRYSEAIMTVRRLFTRSRERSLRFGLKIDGAMPAAIGRSLSGPDPAHMLSGEPVFAAGLCLAARISEDLSGTIPISLSGGLDAQRAVTLLQAGIRPLTLTTELFSAKGFRALTPIAAALNALPVTDAETEAKALRRRECVDVRALRDYVSSVLP
jgi:putative selenate reductase